MKKFLLVLLFAFFAFALVACGEQPANNENENQNGKEETPVTTTYTVVFESDGERFATAKVKEGEKVSTEVGTPTKSGHSFVGWFDGETQVDLTTYVVTKNVTLTAKFVSDEIDNSLDVNAKKEAGKTYTLVIGWWEVKDPDDPDKKTSYLTEELVQKFYANVNLYLKAKGLTDEQIANVQVRNYSTKAVADMGALVNADADVDIMIGVGNNINSTAGVSLYESSNDNKFATTMGTTPTSRYVALTSYATELGVNVYDWLATEVGKTAFNVSLKASDIVIASARTNDANLTLKFHLGEEPTVFVFETKDQSFTLPVIDVEDGYELDGFALTENGDVVLYFSNGETFEYSDVKDLAADATTIDLYPIFSEVIESEDDLVVYVQLNSGLTQAEGTLLYERFYASLEEPMSILFNFVEADAAGFTAEIQEADCADVIIGGNNPLKNFAAHTDGPLANAGAKHFANDSRKVIIGANTQHLELAKKLYDFVTAEAPSYEVHITFWLNENKWITTDELAKIKADLNIFFNEMYSITGDATLESVYNIKVTMYDATKTKVADLGEETRALREGAGTDIIIGCGANVTTTGGFDMALVKDIPTSIIAADRKMALITFNALALEIFHNFFVEETPEVE